MSPDRRDAAVSLHEEQYYESRSFAAPVASVPRVGLVWAARRHWMTVLLPILLLGGLAAAYGLVRDPEYTASTRLVVGRVDAGTPTSALAGFTTATQALAETYSRMATGDAVSRRVGRSTDTRPGEVKDHVAAAPVPNTPVIRLTGKASSEHRAIEYSVVASEALVRRVQRQSRTSARQGGLWRSYKAAALDRSKARVQLDELEDIAAEDPDAVDPAALARADAAYDTASLRAEALRRNFVESTQNQSGTADPQIVDRASSAKSDRNSFLQLVLFAGLAAGALLGLALALARANRDARRLFVEGPLRAVPKPR